MKSKVAKLTRLAIAAASLAAGLSISVSASAYESDYSCPAVCSVSVYSKRGFGYYEAQVNNNNEGGGVTSWIWVYNRGRGDHVDYFLKDDYNMHKLYADHDSSSSRSLERDVTAFRVCGPNGWGGDECSAGGGWAHPKN